MIALQTTWFFLIGFLLIGYAILDGFDLGVGFWHLFVKKDEDRRILLNSIGPVWDGNEVWLLTGAGALFAAFPPVYASVFSGFYLAMMLLLLALIGRASAIEFRSKSENKTWRGAWDLVFSLGSIVAALLFGVALGNVMRGVSLDREGNYSGTFLDLLNPYALLIGVTGLSMLVTHGGLWLLLKTEGALRARLLSWTAKAWIAYVATFVAASFWTILSQPHLLRNSLASPILFAFPALGLGGIIGIKVFLNHARGGRAFFASSLSIAGLLGTVGTSLYPTFLPALDAPERSLTAMNTSSSQLTLTTMLVLALLGMPIVLGYTIYIYRTFRGPVKLDANSY